MKDQLKRSQFVVQQARAMRGLAADARKLTWLSARRRLIASYLRDAAPRKLHIGCGLTPLPGWLNTDIDASRPGIAYLDATRRFPLPDDSFDYVFSEHMIEHIDYADARFMLAECHRILKPGGRLRVATPNLDALLGLRAEPRNAEQEHYLRWIIEHCIPGVTHSEAVFVINNAFRAWGHRFLYDRNSLRDTLAECGFEELQGFAPGVSEDAALQGIESHGHEIGDEAINQFETQIWEGVTSQTGPERAPVDSALS